VNLLDIVARFTADTKPIDQAIDSTSARAQSKFGAIGPALSKGVAAGGKVLAGGAALLFAAAGKGALELQNATLSYQATTGATAEEAKAASESITTLFKNNLTTMDEASGVLAALKTNMGLVGEEAEVAADRMLDFAKVTGQDAVGAVTALDDLTDAYGLSAEQQVGVLDQLLASTQKYGGSVSENQAVLAKLAPTLQAANLSYEDGIGLLNLFAASGIDAS
jgi:phage-related minor tail protein